jgi:DNA-binding transcriptional MerR regulator
MLSKACRGLCEAYRPQTVGLSSFRRDRIGSVDTLQGTLRIGELSRRSGVAPALLRAWEQRYGLLSPDRTEGGLRLYSGRDERRVRAMVGRIAGGLSAAEAARTVLADENASDLDRPAPAAAHGAAFAVPPPAGSELGAESGRLREALRGLDRDGAQQVLDRLLGAFTFEVVAREVLLPYLVDVGARWAHGEPTIAEEHLATQLMRGRLVALGRGFSTAGGARIVLACPPEEHHDIALTILSVALERLGCRVTLLGADTPLMTVTQAAEVTDADCVVLSVTLPGRMEPVREQLRRVAAERPLFLAGPGVDVRLIAQVRACALAGDPLTAAGPLAERFAHSPN